MIKLFYGEGKFRFYITVLFETAGKITIPPSQVKASSMIAYVERYGEIINKLENRWLLLERKLSAAELIVSLWPYCGLH